MLVSSCTGRAQRHGTSQPAGFAAAGHSCRAVSSAQDPSAHAPQSHAFPACTDSSPPRLGAADLNLLQPLDHAPPNVAREDHTAGRCEGRQSLHAAWPEPRLPSLQPWPMLAGSTRYVAASRCAADRDMSGAGEAGAPQRVAVVRGEQPAVLLEGQGHLEQRVQGLGGAGMCEVGRH